MVTLFKEGSTYVTAATLNAALESGQSNFKWDARYAASSYEVRERIEDRFFRDAYDGVYAITILRSDPILAMSGLTSRLKRVGIQPFSMDKRISNNSMRLYGDKAIHAMCDVVDTVLDVYYRVSPGDLIHIGGHTYETSIVDGLVYGPMIEATVQVYLESTSGTSLAAEKFQRFTNIYIGYSGATVGTTYLNLTGGIADFRCGMGHPLWWRDVANTVSASAASQGHQNWWFEIDVEGDYHDAFWTQPVTGAAGTPALVSKADGGQIAYLKVIQAIRAGDGTAKTRTWTVADSSTSTYAYIAAPEYVGGISTYRGISNGITSADA